MKRTPNKKPISYKFTTEGKNGAYVKLKGLSPGNGYDDWEEPPKQLVAVLEKYGFDEDEWCCYRDSMLDDDGLEETLCYIGSFVPVHLSVAPLKGGSLAFRTEIDDTGLCRSRTVWDAINKALKAWNKAGRPIYGVSLVTALDRVLASINAKRTSAQVQGTRR